MPSGAAGRRALFEQVLRPALPVLTVAICDPIAKGDRVVTRRVLRGTQRGPLRR